MKVLAFAASNSQSSINKQLVAYVAASLKNKALADAEIEILDLNDYEMPIYRPDREAEGGIPEQAKRFYEKIGQAQLVLISFAEHNGSYSSAYKNLFDWTSRLDMKVYQDTPVLLMATSPGPGGANNVLATAVNSAPYFGMDVKGSFSLPLFYDNFDVETAKVTDEKLQSAIEEMVEQFKET